jgi:hypothetical protein
MIMNEVQIFGRLVALTAAAEIHPSLRSAEPTAEGLYREACHVIAAEAAEYASLAILQDKRGIWA